MYWDLSAQSNFLHIFVVATAKPFLTFSLRVYHILILSSHCQDFGCSFPLTFEHIVDVRGLAVLTWVSAGDDYDGDDSFGFGILNSKNG